MLQRPSYRPGGRAVDCIGGAVVLSFCDGPWRIRVLAGSGEFFCPSLAFSGDGTAAGAMSGEDPGRLAYHFLEESGEWFLCNCLGGLSLSVARMFGVLGWPAVLVASEPKFLGDVVAGGHLLLLGRSTFLRHVDVFDVLLGEAIKNFVFPSRRASASSCILDAFLFQPLVRRRLIGRLLWAPATKTTGRPLLELHCNFLIFQGCLCKSCNVNLIFHM